MHRLAWPLLFGPATLFAAIHPNQEDMRAMNIRRRTLLGHSLAAGAVGLAVGAGLLSPRSAWAAWPKAAFEAKDVDGAINADYDLGAPVESTAITVQAPDIAENGAVVPVTVSSTLPGVESISLIAAKNPAPLVARFDMRNGAQGYVSTRIKMGKTADLIAVVKAGGKLYMAKKEVKVTIGGCGG